MGFIKYWWLVLQHAWVEAWALVIPHSPFQILRNVILFAIAAIAFYALQNRLVSEGLTSQDNLTDTIIWAAVLACMLVTAFALVFVLHALFVTPYLLWRDLKAQADAQPSRSSDHMGAYQREEWEIALPPNRRGYPDWPIRELCFHIRPDLIEDLDGMEWAEVGNDLKDKFSVGRLSVWGREKSDWVGEIMNEKPALQPISMTYWPKADFTYTFLAEGNEQTDHTYAPEGYPVYRDLQVNKRDALDIWPVTNRAEASHGHPSPKRHLTSEQKRRVANNLSGIDLGQEKFDVFYFKASEECIDYASDIANALTQAGWNASAVSNMWGDDLDKSDVSLQLCGESYNKAAAAALESALQDVGVKVRTLRLGGAWPKISIFVGRQS